MSYIYVVTGYTGHYDGSREWMVKAFNKKDNALEFVKQLTDILIKHNVHVSNYKDDPDLCCFDYRDKIYKLVEYLDKNFDMDYTGTEYDIKELELI